MHLFDKEGKLIKHGSVIRWNCWDNDDYKSWTFTGIVVDYMQNDPPFQSETQYVIYLGGGMDFGMGIGKKISFEEVINDAENNDEHAQGVEVVGSASEISSWIKMFGESK